MRLKFGKEKFGKEKRSKLGKELAVAAPMTAKADNDTTIAGTRLEIPCCAVSRCLSPCVSLSGVSATCVPYVSAQSQDFSSPPISKTKRAVAWAIQRRLSRDCHPIRRKSWAYMVNDQLFSAVSRVRRSAAADSDDEPPWSTRRAMSANASYGLHCTRPARRA